MAKKRGRKILNKTEIAEDWCFECKDGGELMICDYGECLKAYHPACVGKDDSVLTSDDRWICGWHTCLVCRRSSNYQCYCCDRAVCSRCIGRVDFVLLKGKYGFCNNCLKLALLVEEDRNVDSDGESVDLRDRETYEGLFREYYEIVKEKEGFDKNSLLAGKAQLDKEKICQISSDSDKHSEEEDGHSEEEDEQLSSDNGDFSEGESQKKRLKKKRCTQQKTKIQRSVNSKKKVFVGWGSKALMDFLQFIGHDTSEKLSQYDVTSIVTKYIKEHNLIHPVKKRRILCDVRLQAVFGKKVVNRHRIFSLLESHFIENEEQLQKDEHDHDLEDDDTEMLVAPKTEKKVEQKKISSIWYSTAAQSQFAALIPENIKLVYLKRSLLLQMIKQPESIETKIIGSFVRVKLDPRDYEQRNSHQLVQIGGIKLRSSDKCNSEILIQVSHMAGDVCSTMLSDDEFSKEECDDLREKVKASLLKKLTIVELEQKAKILHEDITKHRIARELELLQKLIDRANEKGWRHELFQHLEKRKLLQQPSYLSFVLQNIPGVIPEEVELESIDRNDNQMHQYSDETTPMNQNIPGVTPKKVELEPLAKNEKDVNQMHQCLDETTPTKKNILGVIPEKVELERLLKDERDGNKMHQCVDETPPTGVVKCEPKDGAPFSDSL
ncbi:zinc finger CCCH domain-containing protein 44-like [Solanum dulcamara]|uniref:zinc finger CCCH domain-containing protein 44-like n=1 Tax=Solanum dulcamara TaxID=45834 RepID=UPI0024866960|nr:zinc finger CCCH domain-containing protein 44-like [Solanum dulcamara]XP_055816373.1 zinc finger CCCH domain-containing protein 44-like [Solanum dulcamara]